MSKKLTQETILSKSKVEDLSQVKCLNLWASDIEDIEIISEMKNLEVVSLSGNLISSLRPFFNNDKLSELYLRKNNITNLQEMEHLRACKSLKILWLEENPCCQLPNYREHVIKMLPQLLKLDNIPITSAEREKCSPKKIKYTINVLAASADTTCTDTDRSDSKAHVQKRGSSSTRCEVKREHLSKVTSDLKFQKLKSKSKIPTKRLVISTNKSYESSNQTNKLIPDHKASVVSAIENLIDVLNSPQLKYVKGLIDQKLNM